MERSTGFTANVCKLEVVGWKRFCEPKKMWDEVVENEIGIFLKTLRSVLNSIKRASSKKTCQRSLTLGRGMPVLLS